MQDCCQRKKKTINKQMDHLKDDPDTNMKDNTKEFLKSIPSPPPIFCQIYCEIN